MDTKKASLFLVVMVASLSWSQVKGDNDTTQVTPPVESTSSKPKPPPTLSIVTMLDPPYVVMTPRGEKYTGLIVDLLNEAIKDLGFDSVNWDIHDDARFGYEEKPGQWNGLIGAVQNKTADIAVAVFTVTSKRSAVVDFSHPFMHAGFRALYKIPDSWHSSEAMVTILRPFTPGMWVLLVFMFAVTGVGLYVIGRFSPYEDVAFVGKAATCEGLTLPNSLLYTFSSLVLQGYTAAPRSISGRVLTGVWWVFCIFTVGAYIAGLCVILFRVNPEIRTLPFTTMDELSRTSKVGVMVSENGAVHQYLQRSSGELQKRLLQKINMFPKESLVKNTAEGISKMIEQNGKFVMLMEGPAAEYISTQEPCDKMVIGEPVGDHQYAFACPKGSDLCNTLTTKILELQESGKISELREKWLRSGCLKDKPENYIFEGLPFFDTFGGEPDAIMPLTITVKRFSAAYIILVIGIVLAGLTLVLEIFIARRRGVAVPRRMASSVRQEDDLERIENEFHDERS